MLISKVSEEAGGEGPQTGERRGQAMEYQTASELFDLMTKDTNFEANDDESLTNRDLILLYKNIDIGTKLMNDASGPKMRKPNQHFETVVHNDELESDTDASENYSLEDLHNIFMINQERFNIFNGKPLEHLLYPKFGTTGINSSILSENYDKHFPFQDSYITQQLLNLNALTNSSEIGLFSTSFIDYLCCKRLEDNYNFYMDNIIKYVQNTIEQLKRISNGDYLKEPAKEKWREVMNSFDKQENNTKVLATSTSIPLHVERKKTGNVTWDDIVHSEVDVRSLSKILEKKIVVEIPKLICGSYRLYSKRYSDNLIISCQKEQQKVEQKAEESRVDVVLQLQRSQTGQVISKISSIMILKSSPAVSDLHAKKILPSASKEEINAKCLTNELSILPAVTVIDLNKNADALVPELETEAVIIKEISEQTEDFIESQNDDSIIDTNDYPLSDRIISCECPSNQHLSESSSIFRDSSDQPTLPDYEEVNKKLNKKSIIINEVSYNVVSPDELRMTMQKLNMGTSSVDENSEDILSQSTSKRRSPVRVRIKSPYENKSFLLEEKKRKRLLEIRERREKKKMASGENCKITKHKYGRGSITPQASSSVTKLSITNKSFYNSIYGQNVNLEDKPKPRKLQKSSTLSTEVSSPIEEMQEEYFESPMLTPEKNSKKYINRSYYLDDTETEMMFTHMKVEKETKDVQNVCSTSNSFISNEYQVNFDLIKHLLKPSESNINNPQKYLTEEKLQNGNEMSNSGEDSLCRLPVVLGVGPKATIDNETQIISKKNSTSHECRKSIDQLYDLIKTFDKPVSNDHEKENPDAETRYGVRGDYPIPGSESGTSVKHLLNSSYHSGFSAHKTPNLTKLKCTKNQTAAAPKVIISSKLQSPKIEPEKMKNERKRSIVTSQYKGPPPDNPLKAISQLLQEFDNVQKTRQKSSTEKKSPKKAETLLSDMKSATRSIVHRRHSRLEQHLKDCDQEKKAPLTSYPTPKEKVRVSPRIPSDLARNTHQQMYVDDKSVDKIPKKKIGDILDEAKEAMGEAVRGPSKLNSRLNSLAQPKKSYVLAHHEEYQNRYGRNMLAERLQRLAGAPVPISERNAMHSTPTHRWRRHGANTKSAPSVKQPVPSSPHLDKPVIVVRRSASSSPANGPRPPSCGSLHKRTPETPTTMKKMVEVETYVQSHYGRASRSAELRAGAPLGPGDRGLESMGSCVADARSLRRLGDAAPHSALACLPECPETRTSRSDLAPPAPSPRSSFSPASSPNLSPPPETSPDCLLRAPPTSRGDSCTELKRFESALLSQLAGDFQKRLRIKSLTLTLKRSLQRVFLLQSGDAASVLSHPTLSNMKLRRSAGSLRDFKPALSTSHLDWNFAQIPPQIVTLGYVFPDPMLNAINSKARIMEVSQTTEGPKNVSQDVGTRRFAENRDRATIESGNELVAVPVKSASAPVMDSPLLVEMDQTVSDAGDSLEPALEVETITDGNTDVNTDTAVPDNTVTGHKVAVDKSNELEREMVMENEDNFKEEEIKVTELAPSPEYTSSLDMLVKLLNEIQKITHPNQMVADSNSLDKILNDSDTTKNTNKITAGDLISITSLDQTRQLDSTNSSYSILSIEDTTSDSNVAPILRHESKFTECIDESTEARLSCSVGVNQPWINYNMAITAKPASVDKEVTASICEVNVNRRDVPSNSLPAIDSHSTCMSNYAIDVVTQPSARSILCLLNQQIPYSNTLSRTPAIEKIIELPQMEEIKQPQSIHPDKTGLKNRFASDLRSIQNFDHNVKDRSVARSELRKHCSKNIDLDPMLKIKRDILVTVYSILVLTVFAALSFPDLMMLH